MMSEKKETLKQILENISQILDLESLYSHDMQYWEDELGNIISVSPSCERITGYKSEEFINNPNLINEIILTEDAKIWMKRCDNIKKNSVKNLQFRIRHKSKKVVYVEHNSQRLFDKNNLFIGLKSLNRDITNRKLTNEIINSSSTVLFLWKNEPGFPTEFVSENVKNLLGYNINEFLTGKVNYNDLIHPECLERVTKEVEINIENKDSNYKHEPYRIIAKNKKIKWVSDNTSVRLDSKGNITHFHGIITDITEAKNALDKLKQSEEIFRNIFNHSPMGILHFDKKGIIKDCNNEFASIMGADKEELIGFDMINQIKDSGYQDVIRNYLVTGYGYYTGNYQSIISGKIIPIAAHFNAIFSEDKEIIGGVGLVEDITERTKHEKLQKALFDISATASKTISINELYKELHAIIQELMPAENIYVAMLNTKENLITFPYHVDKYDPSPDPQKFGNGLTEYILRTKKSQIITADIDKELQRKGEVALNGEFSQVWVGIYLEFEGDYKGVLALQDYDNINAYSEEELKILQFVSEQIVKVLDKKYADRRLRDSVNELYEAKKELEIINQNKDRFFSIIAHDLRAPFNTLLGVTEMITGNMDDISMDEIEEISKVIHSSTNNLFKLIENLLNWSRLQMGTFHVIPKKIFIKETVLEVLEIIKYAAKEKNITIINEIADHAIFVDEECLKTVVRNLLNNAIKFTYRSGTILLTSKELETHIKIAIEDNGVGIDDKIIANLFSITSKTSTVGTENEKGTGLGLILCKDLIEKNDGQLWVDSEYGKGSKFSFTIPKQK
ncbi:MAG: hypothetical protein COW71_16635 [Ignavibacteriales bacterium CG18_big_fil_WC_8_21_14_2_50_31_20]|nr:MAG: hypothetical protein COW71_16635 [Ignavibacteriales bacterium CG18_big_fil_WC_8_21_14_2_50_31_20]